MVILLPMAFSGGCRASDGNPPPDPQGAVSESASQQSTEISPTILLTISLMTF
jgi:hypothetical protein